MTSQRLCRQCAKSFDECFPTLANRTTTRHVCVAKERRHKRAEPTSCCRDVLNRPLRCRNFGCPQLANQMRCDRSLWCDITTSKAISRVRITLLHLKRRAGNWTGRVLNHCALVKRDFCAVFSQDHVADRRHIRAKFRCREFARRRAVVERKLPTALATCARTVPPRIGSCTNRRNVVDQPVTSVSKKFAFFFKSST